MKLFMALLFLSSSAIADSFAILGDFGRGTNDQLKAGKALGEYCDANDCKFGVTVGDNFYESGVKSVDDPYWQDRFENVYDVKFKFFASLGNHDYKGNVEAQIDYQSNKWTMPNRYYSFEKDGVTFVAIDTVKFDDAQKQWLEETLKASDKKIVFGHYPLYSYTKGGHGSTKQLVRELLPIMQRNNANIYLAGHDHDLQVIERDGVTSIVCGNAGKIENHGFKNGPGKIYGDSFLGFCVGEIERDGINLKFIDDKQKVRFEHKVFFESGERKDELEKVGQYAHDVNETSGLYFKDGQLYTVDDNQPGNIFEMSLKGGKAESIYRTKGDTEGITWDGKRWLVIRETSGEVIAYPGGELVTRWRGNGSTGPEAISYDPAHEVIFLGNESPPILATIDNEGQVTEYEIPWASSINDISYDDACSCLWVVSSKDGKLYKSTVWGKKLGEWRLGFKGAEGIAQDDDKLYIVRDNKSQMTVYKKPD